MKLVCSCAGTCKWTEAITWLCIQLQAARKKGHFCMFGRSLTDKSDIPGTPSPAGPRTMNAQQYHGVLRDRRTTTKRKSLHACNKCSDSAHPRVTYTVQALLRYMYWEVS